MNIDKRPTLWIRHRAEWAIYDEKTNKFSIKKDAPKEIKESFALWKEKNPKHAV